MLRHIHYSKTISRIVPRILIVTLPDVMGAALKLGNTLLDRDILDVNYIGGQLRIDHTSSHPNYTQHLNPHSQGPFHAQRPLSQFHESAGSLHRHLIDQRDAATANAPAVVRSETNAEGERALAPGVLSDERKDVDVQEEQQGIITTSSPPEDPGPSSKRARTISQSARGSSKPHKRSPSKPIFSHRSSSKRRLARQGRTNWPEAVNATHAAITASSNRAPSLVPGTTRPRPPPPRSPIPEQYRFNDSFPGNPKNPRADLVGLHPIGPDEQQISTSSGDQIPPAQTASEMKKELLTSVVTNALLDSHLNQQIAYLDPATAFTLSQNANQHVQITNEEGYSPSGSLTPRPPSRGEDDEVTPRCVTPAVANSTAAHQKEEESNAESAISADPGPESTFFGH
ncbi:hypothetical protein FRB90_000891 [Tulasnella sp. 427]|nr:hypothetical protein FRB90_000891 [Tulasnella sp. 427]